jgi:hypothetical protein
METQYTVPQKPTLVNVIAWMTLASGIVNLGWGIGASFLFAITIVGLCCVPLTILPAILGIFEIVYAAKLLHTSPKPVKPAVNLAVLEVVCILAGNFFSMIVGILSLIFYNDPAVKDYFARLNGTLPPEPVPPAPPQVPQLVPVTPVSYEEPIPSPIMREETVAPVVEIPAEEPTPPVEEITLVEPPVEPEPPVSPSSSDATIISPVRRDGIPGTEPEPPASPDEPEPSDKPAE